MAMVCHKDVNAHGYTQILILINTLHYLMHLRNGLWKTLLFHDLLDKLIILPVMQTEKPQV